MINEEAKRHKAKGIRLLNSKLLNLSTLNFKNLKLKNYDLRNNYDSGNGLQLHFPSPARNQNELLNIYSYESETHFYKHFSLHTSGAYCHLLCFDWSDLVKSIE